MEAKTYSVEQLIAGSYIKYNVLSKLIFSSYQNSTCTEINLFIDLNSVLKQLYSGDIWTYRSVGKFDIASGIINMCAHYRHFFRCLRVNTNIYLIYGLNCPSANNTFVEGYNSKFISSYIKKPDITKVIDDNLRIVDLISQYIPYVYFFNIGNCEVSSMVDYLIHNLKNGLTLENIIISKDPLMLQLVSEHNARVLRPLKLKDGDNSFIIDQPRLWDSFIRYYRKGKTIPEISIPTTLFQNVLCMTSVPERNIYSVFNINKAFAMLNDALSMNYLSPSQLYTQSGVNTALTAMGILYNPTDLEMRFKALNSHYQAMFILPIEKPEFKQLRLIDLEDIDSLKTIISQYFDQNPIDLDRL